MNASARAEDGMKTNSFITNRKNNRQAGFAAKAAIGVVAVALVGTAGFLLYAKGKPLSENPIAQVTQAIQSSVSPDAKAETQKAESDASLAPESAAPAGQPSVQDQPPGSVGATSVVAKATPVPLRVAPDGMVFLAKRVTISRETGITSFPEGTLVLVKSRAGGKIKGSINGVTIDVPASDTTSTFRQ